MKAKGKVRSQRTTWHRAPGLPATARLSTSECSEIMGSHTARTSSSR